MYIKSHEANTVIQEFCLEIDDQGRLVDLDAQGLALLGYSNEDLTAGLNVIDLLVKEDRPRALENMTRILNGEKLGLEHFTIQTKSNITFSVMTNSRLRKNKKGLHCTVFLPPSSSKFTDLMWEHQQLFKTVMEAIPCGLAMVNSKGHISFWNPAAEKLTGIVRRNVIGKACKKVFNCPNFKQICPLSQSKSRPNTPLCVDVVLNSSGRLIHLQKTSNYIHNSEGQIIGAIESFMDLTEHRKAEEALLEARELVESTHRAKRHFMANMNHEIRTPLNGIIGFLNLMLSEEPTPLQLEYINNAKHSAHLLMSLIENILDFSIIDKGVVDIEITGFSLSSVISSVITRECNLIRNNQVCIHSHLDDDVPDNILGDSGRLYQILKHLVGNSIKFTPSGEIAIRVTRVPTLIGRENNGIDKVMLHFSVCDTGVGIPEQKLDSIFESLCQVDQSLTRSFGGIGIGLNIVKRIVKLLEGRIWMESQADIGTTVHFVLPFRSASLADTDGSAQVALKQRSMTHTKVQPISNFTNPSDKKSKTIQKSNDHKHSLAPGPLSQKWIMRSEKLKELLDAAPKSAEALITELKTEAKSANQHTIERLLLRLLLALRREDKSSILHFYLILERKLRSAGHASGSFRPKGEPNENSDCRR